MSNGVNTKTITTLIAGAVFTAGLVMGFGGYVFAGDPVPGLDITIEQNPGGRISAKSYKSSLSNTKSIGQVRMEVGNILLRYGVGGADINKVTDALEGGGVYEAELKSFLIAIGINEEGVQKILLEFDGVGISKDGAQTVSPGAAGTEGATPPAADTSGKSVTGGELRTPTATTPQQPSASEARENVKKEFSGLDSETRSGVFIKLDDLPGEQAVFRDSATKSVQNLKAAESEEESKKISQELEANRQTLRKSAETLRQDLRKNSQELRDNFRKRSVREVTDQIEKLEIPRIAVAHGKGLRMINRYRSAIARFDHILGRMESRVEKIEDEAHARSVNIAVKINDKPTSAILLIEEAKNMQALNEAKLVELEAKYESLLTGQNPGGIAEEAREIAKELKSEIEKLHGLLDDIKQAITDFNSSVSNTSTSL